MPHGTRHRVTGILNPGRRLAVLRVDGGGRWRLDLPACVGAHYGHRVIVDGVRDGFDVLLVERMWNGDSGDEIVLRVSSASTLLNWVADLFRK